MPIPCHARMRGRASPRFAGRLCARLVPVNQCFEPPCAAEAEVILERSKTGITWRAARAASSSPALFAVEKPEELPLDEHVRRHALVVGGGS